MQNQNKKQPSSSSSSSSRIRSFYDSCRRHLPCSNPSSSIRLAINPTPLPKKLPLPPRNPSPCNGIHRNETVDGNFRRVCDLERELEELEEWLCSELSRLKSHLGSTSDHTSFATTNYFDHDKFEKLECEEGYLYTFHSNHEATFQELLSIQISSPALVPPEDGSGTIIEVLNQMAEMGEEKLMSWLLESMPMTDISTSNTRARSNTNSCITTPNNLLEAILLNSIAKLRHLVLEGLQIQTGTKEVMKWQQESIIQARKEKVDRPEVGPIIVVVLIQPRDPHRGYQAVNEMMIGFVEVTSAENGEDPGFVIKGVHVAGLVARRRNGQVVRNCLWRVSA